MLNLQCRQRAPLQVVGQLLRLENSPQWALLSLTPFQKPLSNQNNHRAEKNHLKSFHALSQLANQINLEAALSLAIETGLSIVDSDLLCIYNADSCVPLLNKFQTPIPTLIFPDAIPSSDLMRLTSPSLWIPGKRVVTNLHRLAKAENFSYLASAPLGQPGAWTGLLGYRQLFNTSG